MQYTVIFHSFKNDNFQIKNCGIFLIFAPNIDCGYTLASTHNLCFGANIRKKVYPCKLQFYYIKVGCKGVFVTRTCFRDEIDYSLNLSYIFHNTYQMQTNSKDPKNKSRTNSTQSMRTL